MSLSINHWIGRKLWPNCWTELQVCVWAVTSMTKAFKSDFIFRLTGFINPEILVDKIKMGQCIPGLKASLVKMLCDLRLQVSIQDGCNNILVRDYFNLHDKLTRNQQKALFVSYDHACGMCRNDILVKGKSNILGKPRIHPDRFIITFCIDFRFNEDKCCCFQLSTLFPRDLLAR